jgi:carbon-monoxide dehydrogenase medium subunit
MYPFTLEQPKTLADAKRLSAGGAQALAGGQTLIASMKQRLLRPERLVDLGGIDALRGIQVDGKQLVIGAMTTHASVAASAEVRKHLPALAALAEGIGDRQVRAMGTMGGSVANNDPAACYPSAVLALGATVVTDRREIAADAFFQGLYTTALEPGELITAIRFPIPAKAAYAKFRQPASRFAMLGVFVAHTGSSVRVAITGGGSGVCRHAGLEAALSKSFTPEAVAGVAIDAADFSGDLHASAAYRAHLVKVQTQAAVRMANG